MEKLQLRVAQIWSQAGGIKGFELVSPTGAALPPFSAGAHVLVHLPNGLVRQYSICNDPSETHRYEIGVLRAPEGRGGSAFMHEGVKVGDLLTIDTPRNNFELREDADTYVLIAGGIGVTPLLAMARRLNRLGRAYKLYYCTRAKEHTAYLELLSGTDFAERVSFIHDGGDPKKGLDVTTLLKAVPANARLYCCGPTGLMNAVREAAAQILTDTCAPEVLRDVERTDDRFHRAAWQALAGADLLGLGLPERVGGAGRGIVEAGVLLEEAGRAVAAVPLWSTVIGGLAIGELGDDDQADRWLAGVAGGDRVLAPAIEELGTSARAPQVRAERAGDGWRLTGTKHTVVAAHLADALVVTASDGDGGRRAFVVPTAADGVTTEPQDTFSRELQALVTLDGAEAEELAGARAVDRVVDLATVGLCALAAGVADGSLKRTAAYVTERQQFGRPIGSFQAVGHRAADCYVDVEAMRLTWMAAASAIEDGSPAEREVAIAKHWAAWGGRRVGHAALHLHGGISIDLDYPIHRYFLWAKQLELRLGGASEQLEVIGRTIAARAQATA